ncbi:MAG: SseB family protein [Clostridiales bacterium]|nr:SseB family protein [Clostridiales bacterium]MDD6539943.1 SseB family protein [Bacillota bacterium]MDD7016564.1 SseB family protein [Bacillota bacterium]MDY4958821.1 SseB family protein [Lentihominibacter sp.]
MSKNKKDNKKSTGRTGAPAPFANPDGLPEFPFGDNRVAADELEKELENGDVLVALKSRFAEEKNQENLIALLKCMKDSKVIVPMRIEMSEEDAARIENATDGEEIETRDEIKMVPEILQAKEKRFFPMFSQIGQIPKEFGTSHNLMSMPTSEALDMAHQIENLDGIVLDAFSKSVAMPFVTADQIYTIQGLAK